MVVARVLQLHPAVAVGHSALLWGILTGCADERLGDAHDAESCELDLHEHGLDPWADDPWMLSEASVGGVEEAVDVDIVDWPIPYGEERMRLTVEYLRFHAADAQLTGDLETDVTMVPRVVVLHWTAGPTATSAWWAFEPSRHATSTDPERALNVSTQFIVDRDGTIYRLFREDLVGRHTIGLNHLAIGVENVGGGTRWPLTEAQVQANVDLVRHLEGRFPLTHLIGHHEYRGLEAHPYFKETDPGFRTFKCDPGPAFMERVRDGVSDLALEGSQAPESSRRCRW